MVAKTVWVFCGDNSTFPSAVFSSREAAHRWIVGMRLSGTLTEYPLDEPVYDWAIRRGHFVPKREDQRSAGFIQRFSSASQEHVHYVDGEE